LMKAEYTSRPTCKAGPKDRGETGGSACFHSTIVMIVKDFSYATRNLQGNDR
jgi:hypothetical protein